MSFLTSVILIPVTTVFGFVGFYVALALLIEIIPSGQYRTAEFWKGVSWKIIALAGMWATLWALFSVLPPTEYTSGNDYDDCAPSRTSPC